jgi:NIMA (never in mitosis gene a)-related kinase
MIGTPYYVSPELVNEEKYSYKSDVWAIGCILYELCYLKRAYDGKNMIEIVSKIC